MTREQRAVFPPGKALFGAFFIILILCTKTPLDVFGATLTVTNANDSGAGSLRQAILDANSNPGLDTIVFDISGTNVHTITPATPLPPINDPAVIDGTTQSGFTTNNKPVIEINGMSAGAQSGLRLNAGGTTVRGLLINRCGWYGIEITGPGTNVVQGNFIGTDPGGTLNRGNGFGGIHVLASTANIIGGTNFGDRNLISANGSSGVFLEGAAASVITGNFIGTGIGGAGWLPNGNHGITVSGGSGNVIGGTAAGARNLISGNTDSGVFLSGASTSGTIIQGNYIGTDFTGSLSISNGGYGVSIVGAVGSIVGGTNAGAGNLISGNGHAGVDLNGASTANNVIQGNLIGTDSTGTLSVGNMLAGISMSGATGTLIGGTSVAARNVIAGNKQDGILISTNAGSNFVQGNYIGVEVSGATALANLFNGVSVSSANANTIGGTVSGARNIISGNASYGIQVFSGATGTLIQGNYIGTDANGQLARGNQLSGIRIETPGNSVGGSVTGARNVIAGNSQDGVFIVGAAATGNVVAGNYIGTDASGTISVMNARGGVGISGAPANTIGGTAAGAGNLISGNSNPSSGDAGIYLISGGATGNLIQGNLIGTDSMGMLALGNNHEGIYAENAPGNTIGGSVPGAGNVISGNHTRGIFLTNSSGTVIQGNLIGTKIDGVSAMGNTFHAVECEKNANNTVIGGNGSAGNRIGFSQTVFAGVRIRNNCTNNAIIGNAIFSNGPTGNGPSGGLGIDLGTVGTNANVACGGSSGSANMGENFPVLTQAVTGNGTGVRGTLNSRANTSFVLQFFANPACDPSGCGEGQIYLGQTSVTTSGCATNFVAELAASAPVGYALTATATDPANNTSEFSMCISAGPIPALTLSGPTNNQLKLAWTNTATGFVLKQTDSLWQPVQWTTVTNSPVITNGQFVVTQSLTSSNRFYLLSFE